MITIAAFCLAALSMNLLMVAFLTGMFISGFLKDDWNQVRTTHKKKSVPFDTLSYYSKPSLLMMMVLVFF